MNLLLSHSGSSKIFLSYNSNAFGGFDFVFLSGEMRKTGKVALLSEKQEIFPL
jgi:hypothetical protein